VGITRSIGLSMYVPVMPSTVSFMELPMFLIPFIPYIYCSCACCVAGDIHENP
jgi:hypothetical protein